MSVLDKFYKKDLLITKSLQIENSLYDKLIYISGELYDIPINKLINACIDELIESKNIRLYEHDISEILVKTTMTLREYSLKGLEELKDKYKISVYRLVNIAIRNIVDEVEMPLK